MASSFPLACDLAIVGAGPAGMAAAVEAAALGIRAILFDENPQVGGQIYRGIAANTPQNRPFLDGDYWRGKDLLAAFLDSGATHVPGALVWNVEPTAADEGATLRVSVGGVSRGVHTRRVILATGAMERPMPVRGWTLPGVMTVGAGQIALKAAGLVPEGRIVLAGSGPLLHLWAQQVIGAGGEVAALLDTTPQTNLLGALPFLPAFLTTAYARKGIGLIAATRWRVAVHSGVRSLEVSRRNGICVVSFHAGRQRHVLEADSLFLHQGIQPNNNLAAAAGCRLVWNEEQACFRPDVSAVGASSVPGLFIAGDGAGIVGARAAEADGRIAALAACRDLLPEQAAPIEHALCRAKAERSRLLRGRAFIDQFYRPAAPFRTPPDDATLVCRCEEVTAGTIRALAAQPVVGINQLKTMLRCGMGPCQGRMCMATVTELLAQAQKRRPAEIGPWRLRPPIKPVPLGEFASFPLTPAALHAVDGDDCNLEET
ncbi:NAD(P)/FAD-dependent oxidoreductase [Brucella intermedia]|uniref:FAD/NAD(P)-dependent oxidoreductase n=1 Tax=Brucella intermedia TaxID=94625 RepID=UPI00224929C0|nr:FAD-dependent oxidoreductase [Brucella intermedia]